MSVQVTVSWSFAPPGFLVGPAGPVVEFDAKTADDALAHMVPVPVQVLPAGSSVVSPGLGVLVPAYS